uniref:HpcH/HpaI aldolase/citrate lyase family protein n=1 Tax=Nocardia farcinica TaxID=37329 RepID=UPI0024553FFF
MTAPVALRQEVSLRKRLPLRHFRQLHGPDLRHLFHRQPEPFGDRADRELLAIALGATLYAPATRADLADTIRRRAERGVCSMVIDLEDAVADHEVETAKRRAVAARGPRGAPHETPPPRVVGGLAGRRSNRGPGVFPFIPQMPAGSGGRAGQPFGAQQFQGGVQ